MPDEIDAFMSRIVAEHQRGGGMGNEPELLEVVPTFLANKWEVQHGCFNRFIRSSNGASGWLAVRLNDDERWVIVYFGTDGDFTLPLAFSKFGDAMKIAKVLSKGRYELTEMEAPEDVGA